MEGFVLKLVDRHHVAVSREPQRHLKACMTIVDISVIFILNFVWRPFFALLNCFLRFPNSFPFKTLFSPHSCRFREATWPLPGERQRVPT